MQEAAVKINPVVVYILLALLMLTPVIASFYKFFKETSRVDRKYGVKGKKRRKR